MIGLQDRQMNFHKSLNWKDLPKLIDISQKVRNRTRATTPYEPSDARLAVSTPHQTAFSDACRWHQSSSSSSCHHISVMELGHLLTRSGLMYPEVSSQVCLDSICQLGNSVSLPWVIYYDAFYLHVVSSFSCIPVICPKLALFLISLQFVYLFCNLSTDIN